MSTNVGKGLAVIQEELHRMRMATKAQVDSLEIQREVRSQADNTSHCGCCSLLLIVLYKNKKSLFRK